MIVLDTHALVWWVNRSVQLSDSARSLIEKHRKHGQLIISSITAWEVALLVAKGRLKLSMDVDSWLHLVSQIDNLEFLPLGNKVLVESTRLPGEFHKDPADRMIVAQARVLSAPLLTADERIQAYPHVKAVW